MMLDRHRMLLTQLGGSSFAIPTFDGSHAIFGDEKQGYIECYSSGTITFPKALVVDIFAVAGGDGGESGRTTSIVARGGNGGASGAYKTITAQELKGDYTVIVGSGASNSSFGTILTASGNSGINGGSGGAAYPAPGAGQYSLQNGYKGKTGVYPFEDSTFNGVCGTGGGGGATATSSTASGGAGGAVGGGTGGSAYYSYSSATITTTNGTAGVANTGGGGGGGGAVLTTSHGDKKASGGAGGSGIVIIRWGYAA